MTSEAGSSKLIEQTTSFMVTERTMGKPSEWTGPSAVLYMSFDSSDGLVLMEGNQSAVINSVPLVSGKVQ